MNSNESWLPYQENEEDEEDVGEEEDGSEDAVGLLDLVEVEVPEDRPQQREDGVGERGKVLDLSTKSRRFQLPYNSSPHSIWN